MPLLFFYASVTVLYTNFFAHLCKYKFLTFSLSLSRSLHLFLFVTMVQFLTLNTKQFCYLTDGVFCS